LDTDSIIKIAKSINETVDVLDQKLEELSLEIENLKRASEDPNKDLLQLIVSIIPVYSKFGQTGISGEDLLNKLIREGYKEENINECLKDLNTDGVIYSINKEKELKNKIFRKTQL